MEILIYQNSNLGVCNTYIKTIGEKYRSVSQIEAYSFLKNAKKRDIPFMLDGKVPFLYAVK